MEDQEDQEDQDKNVYWLYPPTSAHVPFRRPL